MQMFPGYVFHNSHVTDVLKMHYLKPVGIICPFVPWQITSRVFLPVPDVWCSFSLSSSKQNAAKRESYQRFMRVQV